MKVSLWMVVVAVSGLSVACGNEPQAPPDELKESNESEGPEVAKASGLLKPGTQMLKQPATALTEAAGPRVTGLELPAAVAPGQRLPVKVSAVSPSGISKVLITFGDKVIVKQGRGAKSLTLSETFTATKLGDQRVVVMVFEPSNMQAGRADAAVSVVAANKLPTQVSGQALKIDVPLASKEVRPLTKVPGATIPAPITPPPGPDLTFSGCHISCTESSWFIDVTDGPCANGYTSNLRFQVETTLKNQGTEAAVFEPGWKMMHIYDISGSGSYSGWSTGDDSISFTAGFEESYPEPWGPSARSMRLSPGVYVAKFVVDPDNHIAETDETNNTHICNLTVVPAPPGSEMTDVALWGMNVSPVSGPGNTPVKAMAVVDNLGTTDLTDLKVSCTWGSPVTIESLTAGQSRLIESTITSPMTAGDQTVTCTVDPDGQIEEAEEDNNQESATFTVTD